MKGLHLDEDAMEQMVLTLPMPAFVKDTSSRFVVCNQAFADYAAIDRGDIVGKTDTDMPWAEYGAASYRDWDLRIMDTGESVIKIAETIKPAEGNVRPIETNKFPVLGQRGAVVGLLGHFQDFGQPFTAPQTQAQPEPPLGVEDIVMRYLAGESVSRISQTTDTAPSAVYAALRAQDHVARWQSAPTSWDPYPVFLAAVRSCRLALLRDQLRLERRASLSGVVSDDLSLTRQQIDALNQAISEADLDRVRNILAGYFEHRTHELRALAASTSSPDRPILGSEWATRFPPSVMNRRYVDELEQIDADRQSIDHELDWRSTEL